MLPALLILAAGGLLTEQSRLTASDGAAGDLFGIAVALCGETAVVGGSRHDPGGQLDAGAAWVFARAGLGWSEVARLVAADAAPGDDFGWALALEGDTLVVAAAEDDHSGVPDAGSAYVFVRSGGSWSEQAKLVASDPGLDDDFGHALALQDGTLAVGAEEDDHAGGVGAGSVYVFAGAGASWSEQAKLVASDAADGDVFGASVALDGGTLLVGAVLDDHGGTADAGSAYVYVRGETGWSEQAKLVAGDAASDDRFGWAVALEGDLAVVGAFLDDHAGGVDAGSVRLFERVGSSWSAAGVLVASDAAPGDRFGYQVALQGSTLVVGALGDDRSGATNAGSAYVFERGSAGWSEVAKLTASDAAAGDQLGARLCLDGRTALVGAPLDDRGAGADAGSALVFVLAGGSLPFCDGADGALALCPCANPGAPDAGCDNAQGTGGVRAEVTALDLAAGTAVLSGSGYPPLAAPTAIVLRSAASEATPAATFDGVRCVGLLGLVRLAAATAGGGRSSHALGHGAGAGTFYYQIWYRNAPASFCDPLSAANLSSGQAIVW